MSMHPRPDHDWFDGVVPANADLANDVWIDTTYGFERYASREDPGLEMAHGSGAYGDTTFDIGPAGQVRIGAYTCLNSTRLICNEAITIGAHCLIAWGSVITDTAVWPTVPVAARRDALRRSAFARDRRLPPPAPPAPVVIEDAVWIGFGSVIMPGVRLGRGCIVGCKTVVDRDVPPLAVVVGNPCRIVRYLDPEESDTVRASASARDDVARQGH